MIDSKMFLQYTMVDFTQIIFATISKIILKHILFLHCFNLSRVWEFQVKLLQKQEIQVKNNLIDTYPELLHQLFCK